MCGLVLVGVEAHPLVDRGDVARAGEPVGDEDFDLGEHVLVEHGGTLRDERRPQSAGAAAADEVFHCSQQRSALGSRVLWGELVCLVEHDVQGAAVSVVELGHEGGEESAGGGLGEQGCVDDCGDPPVDDDFGDDAAGALLEGHVCVGAAEDDDGQAWSVAGAVGAQSPPHADRVDDADRNAELDEFLDDDAGGVGLALAAPAEDRDRLGGEVDRKRQVGSEADRSRVDQRVGRGCRRRHEGSRVVLRMLVRARFR